MKIKVFSGSLNDGPPVEGRMVVTLDEWLRDNPDDAAKVARGTDVDNWRKLDYYDELYVAATSEEIYSKHVFWLPDENAPGIVLCGVINLVPTLASCPDARTLRNRFQDNVLDAWQKKLDAGTPVWPPYIPYWMKYGYTDKTLAYMRQCAADYREFKQKRAAEQDSVQNAHEAARDKSGNNLPYLGTVARFAAGAMVSSADYERLATEAGVWSKIAAGTRGSLRKNVSEVGRESLRITRGKSIGWIGASDVYDWCVKTIVDWLDAHPDVPTHQVVTYTPTLQHLESSTPKGSTLLAYVPGYRWRAAGYSNMELVSDPRNRAFCVLRGLDSIRQPDGRLFPLVSPGLSEAGLVTAVTASGEKLLVIYDHVCKEDVPHPTTHADPDASSKAAEKFRANLADILAYADAPAKVTDWVREQGVSAT